MVMLILNLALLDDKFAKEFVFGKGIVKQKRHSEYLKSERSAGSEVVKWI